MSKSSNPGPWTGDFLKKEAQTPLHELFLVADTSCEIWTNSEPILAAAGDCFVPLTQPGSTAGFRMRFWVDSQKSSRAPWPRPYFRGFGHLIFGGLDSENSILVDLRSRRAIGRFSPELAADGEYWKKMIFPRLLSAMGSSLGITELHCGCVDWKGCGLVLAGAPGAGKSTLTMALAQNGFSLLSEDWTYFSRRDGQVRAWGLACGLKLLPDAVQHFPELEAFETGIAMNGERAYLLDPERDLHLSRSRGCEPRWLVFLERGTTPEFELTEMPAAEAETRLAGDLLAELPEVRSFQLETIRRLAGRGCWRLRHAGEPATVASRLTRFCLSHADTLTTMVED